MNRNSLYIVEVKTIPSKKFIQRSYRKITEMFVIDGVELAVIYQVSHVRYFDNCYSIFFQ